MLTVYIGTRTNIEIGKETYTSRHKGTHAYLTTIRCDSIDMRSITRVDDGDCDANGRFRGAGPQAHA